MGASSDSPVANSPKPDQHEAAPEVDLAQSGEEEGDRPGVEDRRLRRGMQQHDALRELARGEQTATAMEANLSDLESKLDALLAAFEQLEDEKGEKKEGGAPEQKSRPEEK